MSTASTLDLTALSDAASPAYQNMQACGLLPEHLADFMENGAMSLHIVNCDGTIMWANKHELVTLGYELDEYIGRRIADFHVDELTAADMLRRLSAGETLNNFPAKLRHKDGSTIHVEINSSTYFDEEGRPAHMRCFMRDVTVVKLAELEKERIAQQHAQHLEEVNARLQREVHLNLALLHQMMPAKVASDLTAGRKVPPEVFEHVTIFFSDVQGFTKIAAAVQPNDVIHLLNQLYVAMDHCASLMPVYKVETIGDAYMVVGGLPDRTEGHTSAVADFALLVREAVKLVANPLQPETPVRIRIGIHSGPVIAGVAGNLMPRYCLFGDAVNTASRMESTGEAGRIHCSREVALELQRCGGGYVTQCRGAMEVKGKGRMTTYWLQAGSEGNPRCNKEFVAKVLMEVRELISHTPHQNEYQNLVREAMTPRGIGLDSGGRRSNTVLKEIQRWFTWPARLSA